ncbi:WecB/TagA/CpsF family glycosyltransferase [Candidatus Viridilinea mediisalina]|uniref:WecB/TagA/CpsF family glycosyltransferase n=1 Tax=Candidatus Viridilinea mediisalina TaxID=2024553 RepID=UPI0013FDE9AB|nr:WecB/TagA/CpsF family glycosyltransferase [Candidatus Viridilinea mediisalina]
MHPLQLEELLGWLKAALAQREQLTVFYANVHAVNLAQDDALFRAAYAQADLVFCDGQGLRLGSALLGRPLPARFTPPDWIDQLMLLCANQGYRVFLLGGQPGVAAAAVARLHQRYPTLTLASHHGYILDDPHEATMALAALGSFTPDLLLVGMGMPQQERWIAAQREQLVAPVVMSVGALFDYLADTVPRGPRWLTDHGFEWLCRLWYEPQRLWRRYLLGNPRFFALVLQQLVRERLKKVG